MAKDIAEALGYSNSQKAVRDHCKHAKTLKPNDSFTFHPQTLFIPKGDIYRLIVRSQLPGAERFESWVFDEVLVSIDKHGMYATPTTVDAMLADPDTAIQMLTALKREQEARLKAQLLLNLADEKERHKKPPPPRFSSKENGLSLSLQSIYTTSY